MSFDSGRKVMVLFGGDPSGNGYSNDTWEYDGKAWTQKLITPPAALTARYGSGMAYYPDVSKTVLFGGKDKSSSLGDTYTYDGTAWTSLSPTGAPLPRRTPMMVYDSVKKKLLLFGGKGDTSQTPISSGGTVGSSTNYYNDTYYFDGVNWAVQTPSNAPLPRYQSGMTYDSSRSVAVVFGGTRRDGNPSNDTWEWSSANLTWTQISTTSQPSNRELQMMSFDGFRGYTVFFGGRKGGTEYNDLWEYNGSWTQRSAIGPSARYSAMMAFDSNRNRTVLFGGWDTSNNYDNDTWEYYSRGSGTCSTGSQCETGNCVDGVCCVQAACGTCQACNQYDSTNHYSPGVCTQVAAGSTDPDSCTGTSVCTSDGHCLRNPGQSCTDDTQCSSGHCSDSVCCTTACSNACDSCNQTGLSGYCYPAALGSAGSPACGAYVCNGYDVTCPASCFADGACATGYYCNLSTHTCLVSQANGSTCSSQHSGRDCLSGDCIDGYCCNSTCENAGISAGCERCDVASHQGTCWPVASGTATTTCAQYLCTGSSTACPTTCSSDTNCATGFYCSGGFCVGGQVQGASCSSATHSGRDCASGYCVDGYCCNSACESSGLASSACMSCSRIPGTCSAAPAGSSGSPACSGNLTCNGSSNTCPATCAADTDCASGFYCNGTSCVSKGANGSGCSRTAQCSSGYCVGGVCCSAGCTGGCNICSTGTCMVLNSGQTGSGCGGYLCNGTSAICPGSCTSDANCASGYFCNGGQCITRLANASSCDHSTMCQSGVCSNGVCCATVCSGACQACNLSGTVGTCANVTTGTAGNPPCSGNLLCAGGPSCPASCTSDANCLGGYYCSGGSCVAKKGAGSSCTAASQCASGFCTDIVAGTGVCCSSACSGSCASCAIVAGTCTTRIQGSAGSPSCSPYVCSGTALSCPAGCGTDSDCATGYYCGSGTCKTKQSNGATCTSASQCTSGSCSDGFCCSAACAGGCDVCAKSLGASSDGVCTVLPAGNAGSPSCSPNTCDGTSGNCPGGCTSDSGCGSSYYCNGAGQCVAQLAKGSVCDRTRECSTGNCVDGYCCDTACSGGCDACNLVAGTCTKVSAGGVGVGCGNYLCSGSSASCLTSCASDTDCVTGTYCNGTSCVSTLAQGATCSRARQCASSNCVDGYCCNSACAGACDVCNATPGTCTPVAAGSAGSPTCGNYKCDGASASCPTSCSTDANCSSGNYCSSGACVPLLADGNPCSSTTQCVSGFCAGNICCHTDCSGACQTCSATPGTCTLRATGSAGSPSCTPYMCGGAATCPTSCTLDTQCVNGYYCASGGTCKPKLGNGGACSAPNQCVSAFCADGFCCNGACGKGCDRCDLAATIGTCTTVPRGDPGTNPMCSPFVCSGTSSDCPTSCSSDADCASTAYCDQNVCVLKKAQGSACTQGKECQNGNCADNYCCESACAGPCDVCNATPGKCTLATGAGTPTCEPYVCKGATAMCPTTCKDNTDCSASSFCQNGKCAGKEPNGTDCTADTDCNSGHCVDGVCCVSACSNPCDSCNVVKGACAPSPAGTVVSQCEPYMCNGTAVSCPNTCVSNTDCDQANGYSCIFGNCTQTRPLGQPCAQNSDCASQNCVDGVCCNTPCSGFCQACNLPSSIGSCTQVPVGTDPRQTCPKGTGVCTATCGQAGLCGFPDNSTTCKPADCEGTAKRYNGAICDGKGACVDQGETACGAYLCANAVCPAGCLDDTVCSIVDGIQGTCVNGTCGLHHPTGEVCSQDGECDSLHCVDGICCESSCDGKCQRCDIANPMTKAVDGVCRVQDHMDKDNECPGTGLCRGTCVDDGTKMNKGTCLYPDNTLECDTCLACNGKGGCTELPPTGDDDKCGIIDCTMLNSQCKTFASISKARCVGTNMCARANDDLYCKDYSFKPDGEPCTLAGGIAGGCQNGICVPVEIDMAGSAPDMGGAPEKSGCGGCNLPSSPDEALFWVVIGLGYLATRRRKERS
jgi:hypothetical protein